MASWKNIREWSKKYIVTHKYELNKYIVLVAKLKVMHENMEQFLILLVDINHLIRRFFLFVLQINDPMSR